MDLLNNIWVALSTPNEGLINLIFIVFNFIEMFVSMQFFITILNISCTRKQKLLYTVLTSLITCLTKIFIPNPWNVVVNYFILFVCIYEIFKLNVTKTAIAFICQIFIVAIVASLILKPFMTLMEIPYQHIQTIPIYKIIFSLLSYFIIILITFILKHKKIKVTLLDNFDIKSKSFIILSLCFGIFFIIAQLILNYIYRLFVI